MNNSDKKSQTILDAFFLFEALQTSSHLKNIRINKWEVPYYRELILYDYCMDLTGDQEDRLYVKKSFYHDNIRRGNTIIQILDKNTNHLKTTFFGRKGLRKFFDLREEYIDFNLKQISNDDFIEKMDARATVFTPSEHFKLNNLIFNPIKEAFENKSEIEVFKLLKANGENCQIAWIDTVQSWIIASKNVSLLARNEDDIELYQKERFNYAKLIAKTWFTILQRIEARGADIISLKSFLKKHTFVGEYVGNPDCQHLVHYQQLDILFFAIINNQIDEECLSPLESFKVFSQYYLNTVRIEDIGVFKTFDDLNRGLKLLYMQISSAELELEQEGCVLYFLSTKSKQILSLCKIKTLEYKIFRKLREKLRYFIKYYYNLKFEPFQSFYNEVEELCQVNKPPKPLDFYYKICQFSIDFIDENVNEASIVHQRFVTFLYCVIQVMSNNSSLTISMLKEANISSIWPNYNLEYILKYQFKNSSKTHKKNFTNNNNNNDEIIMAPKSNNNNNIVISIKKKLFLIIPIMLPGNGKTFLIPYLHEALISEKNFSWEAISSDKIRKECMSNLAQRQPTCKEEKLFEQTGKIANINLTKNIEFQIRNIRNSNKEFNFLFIDKNHTPNTFEKVIENARKMVPEGVELSIVALCPECNNKNQITTEQAHFYPFSWKYFFTCLYRVQNRTEHETLVGKGEKSANVMIMYLQLFRDFLLSDQNLKQTGFDSVVRIDLTEEQSPFSIDKRLCALLSKILDLTEMKKKCEKVDLVIEFLQLFEKQIDFAPSLSRQYLLETSRKLIKNCLENAPKSNFSHEKSLKMEEKKEKAVENFEPKPRKIIKTEKKPYSPKSIPLLLGVYAIDNVDCKPKILNFIRANLTFLKTQFPDDEIIATNLNSLTKHFFLPREFKANFLEINRDLAKTELSAYRNFQENLRVKLEFSLLFFIPDKVLAGLFNPFGDIACMIENKFPYMVFMMKENPTSEIMNKSLNEFFQSSKELLEKYGKKEIYHEKSFCFKNKILFERKKIDVYLSKIEKGIEIEGETTAYFENKSGK